MIETYLRPWLEQHDLQLTILWDPLDQARFLLGLGQTLTLALSCIALSLVIGVLGAALKSSPWRPLRLAIGAYVELLRNTPLLVQVFLFYFGIGSLFALTGDGGDSVRLMGNTQWAIVAIGLHCGAFQIEAMRAGIDAVPRSTLEAAEALGLKGYRLLRHVVLPLALRNSLPAVGNTIVQTVKSTAVAYAIAVPELLYAANRIWSDNLNVALMMQVLLITYLLLIWGVSWMLRRVELQLRLPGHHPR
jgi:polar amino acid transport system permease protein